MKKLIFCFDGTGNEPADVKSSGTDDVTNIVKLHMLFGGRFGEKSHEEEYHGQKNYYYSGVATSGGPMRKWFNKNFAPKFLDVRRIIDKAIHDVEAEDNNAEVYVFGFSRGAALARRFATLINRKVMFLGVFDTVVSIGLPDFDRLTLPSARIVFGNGGKVATTVKKAVHLLALDENRVTFQPTLFNLEDKVTELWFSGSHADVGGGLKSHDLSDITLNFMCKQAKDVGLKVLELGDIKFPVKFAKSKDSVIEKYNLNISPMPEGHLTVTKPPRLWLFRKFTPLFVRKVRVNYNDQPSPNHIPIIHHTVLDRCNKVNNYRPAALDNIKFNIMKENGDIDNTETSIYPTST